MQQIVFFHDFDETDLKNAIKKMQEYGASIKSVSVFGESYKDYAVLYEYNCNLNDVVSRIEKLKVDIEPVPLD